MADPYWSNVVFLAGYEGTSPTDESPLAQTVTAYGTTAVSTSQAKFGSKSLKMGASSTQGITVPYNAAFNLGSGSFTIETFAYFPSDPEASTNVYIMTQSDPGTNNSAWELTLLFNTGTLDFTTYEYGNGTGGSMNVHATGLTIATGTWYHIAVDFNGTTLRLYFNGTCVASSTTLHPVATVSTGIAVGSLSAPAIDFNLYNAYLDETRVTVGVARYATSTSFTVPTAAFPRYGPAGVVVTELVTFVADATRAYGSAITMTDTVTMTSAFASLTAPQVIERVQMALVDLVNQISNVTAADSVSTLDGITPAQSVAISDVVTLTLTQTLQSAATIIDQLGIADTLATTFKYTSSWADQLMLADQVANFIGVSASDQMVLDSAMTVLLATYNTIAETVTVTETPTPQFLLAVNATEEITLTAAELIQGIYSGTIADTIELTGGYMDPGGGLTTWAINTRSGAVTEYQNYPFNSFARIGNKYVGASETGLYELAGDTDNGTSIVATLKGAYLQFGGPHLSRLKEAYIAHTGVEGKFVLKIETQDGKSYTYQIDARSGRNSKFNMGKGQRSRYFAYTLTSTGQDFNLDTLEFVPIVVQRRV